MPTPSSTNHSALRDNREKRGNVGDFLKEEIQDESVLSFVSAYFTVHAYQALADKLENAHMAHETMPLDAAVESIKRTFARRASASLFSGRDGLLPKASETPSSADDMELVTWLIVMGSSS
jgi:hypothetical protein